MMGRLTWRRSAAILLVLGCLIFFLVFGRALFQEGDPLPVIGAIVRLETSSEDIVPITTGGLLISRAGDGVRPLTGYLAAEGWDFSDQLGSAIFFQRDDKRLDVQQRMFTRFYVIYDLGSGA